jgi:nicotinate-nucleotide--dimethylbenzimidazole phosphoribosyltransferase
MTAGTLPAIRGIDPRWIARANERLDRLTKPPGSLGRLELVAARLCGIQETLTPVTVPSRILIFAADHGVARHDVSAYPSVVTAQMVGNFLNGGAAINALAGVAGADVWVFDVGVATPIDARGSNAAFVRAPVGAGTANMVDGPAMTAEELESALTIGISAADAAARAGIRALGCGDMGIGNTTAASAITAAVTGASVAAVTGRGTGIDDGRLTHKIAVITAALEINDPQDPYEALRCFGGFEIAAIVGAYLGAAAHRMAIIGDGFVATAAALVAAQLCPAFVDFWFAGHRSPEPGHAIQLDCLGQKPLLDLEMRLGEATGAALALPLLTAAAAMITNMATFDEAGVSTSA